MSELSAPRAPVSRASARAQARAIIEAVEASEPGVLDAIRTDVLGRLGARGDISVRTVPESQTDAGCSVAGAYLSDVAPPVVAVADSLSKGRRVFTALHEWAHHHQQTITSLMPPLLAEADGGHRLEDAACDAFAAAVLLPDELVDKYVGVRGPTADGIVMLRKAALPTSRAAVCVRVSERLTSPGHVILLDEAGRVQFAAAHGLPPLRRDGDQGHIPVVRDALRRQGRAQGRTRFAYRDGIVGAELYVQVAPLDDYLLVVAVTDSAPWEVFSPPARDPSPVGRYWTCENAACGHEFRTFDAPCTRCKAPTCPECGRCNCPSGTRERRCDSCGVIYPVRMFAGAATRCTNCT